MKKYLYGLMISALMLSPLVAAAPVSPPSGVSIQLPEFIPGAFTRADGSEGRYYLLARNKGPGRQLLVLIQGSDCNSARNNRFMVETFGSALPEYDILLVEKYGITDALPYYDGVDQREDCPQDAMLKDTLSVRVSDYTTVLTTLKPRYDTVVALGGSEGATVAEQLGLALPQVNAVVALNGGGRFFLDDVTGSMRSGPQPAEESVIRNFIGFTDAVKSGEIPEDMLVSFHGPRWWQEYLAVDALQALNSLNKPVLVIQTMNDTNVNTDTFVQLRDAVTNPQVTFKTFDNLDHGFRDAQGERQTDAVLRAIRDWHEAQNHQ